MPVITLPDGSKRDFDSAVTVLDVAADIGPGLAKATLAGVVSGQEVDASYLIEEDANLSIVTDRSDEALEIIRHSTAHLLAMAVKELFPSAQVTIGPVIENGFYYDFSFERAFTPEDLEAIRDQVFELVKSKDRTTIKLKPYRIITKNKNIKWVKANIDVVRNERGKITNVQGIVEDITEQKKLEHQMSKALEKEIELNELKSGFVSLASHEFRTPLTSILASAELLEVYGKTLTEEKYYSH